MQKWSLFFWVSLRCYKLYAWLMDSKLLQIHGILQDTYTSKLDLSGLLNDVPLPTTWCWINTEFFTENCLHRMAMLLNFTQHILCVSHGSQLTPPVTSLQIKIIALTWSSIWWNVLAGRLFSLWVTEAPLMPSPTCWLRSCWEEDIRKSGETQTRSWGSFRTRHTGWW